MRRWLVLWLAVGCGAGLLPAAAARASSESAQAGWQPRRVPAAGIVVSAPNTWVDFSRTTPHLLEAMRGDPSLRYYADLVRRSNAIKLVLVDLDPRTLDGGFATNMNVVQAHAPAGVDLELAADSAIAQLNAVHRLVRDARRSRLRLPAGRALEVRFLERIGSREVAVTQFYLLHESAITVVTYSTLATFAERYRPVFVRSARSLRFL